MKKIVLVYDDTLTSNERIKTIIGNKTFGNIILKRKSMFVRTKELVEQSKTNISITKIHSLNEFSSLATYPSDTVFFHLLSSSAVNDPKAFEIILEKIKFANETFVIKDLGNKTLGIIFNNRKAYLEFLEEYKKQHSLDFVHGAIIDGKFLTDLSDYDKLLMFISGGFDARFFNSLSGDAFTVTKKSADKKKMKMEYTYYWLLPEHMKMFMVMPFNYTETEEYGAYTMERMPMTDIAIRWTHEAIDLPEFQQIMVKTAYFLTNRETRPVSKKAYLELSAKLYLAKLDERITKLKTLPEYKNIAAMIKSGTSYDTIDEIVSEYRKLYTTAIERVTKHKNNLVSVIGHGDLFFANMLFSKETGLLRLIDPKGALKAEDLWTDPYYDIAKLSHSICGSYDFFNTGAYDIALNDNMQYELHLHRNTVKYQDMFKDYLTKAGYDYIAVRIFETSLFLSMLPLHIDNPRKVFGFILNAINIMKEIEENV